jgi:putative intracellular protease/amidase
MAEESILMVVTGAAHPAHAEEDGLNAASLTGPRAVLAEAGARITITSPRSRTLETDETGSAHALENVWEDDFDAIFVAGGPGALVDLPDNPLLISLIERSIRAGRPVAAVAEGVAAWVGCKTADGGALVQNRRLTCPADEEGTPEAPFDLAHRLRQLGAILDRAAPGCIHVLDDDGLISGQNPESALEAARCLIERLK